ncbi:hypothetical protein ACLBXM_20130 [Xanthobacteraceae bacterium A53D]
MGLSSFNRMRRELAAVEKIEAERFKLDNEARHAARAERDEAREAGQDLAAQAERAEAEAVQAIGAKNEAGMETAVPDLPLRQDHAAEIAGRNLDDVQEPKDPVERIDERIPQGETANEKLVEHMSASQPGPSAELVEAAQREAGALPEAADGEEGIAPKGETSKVVAIPAHWQSLTWQERRSIAAQVSDSPIRNGDDANAAIEAELKRRG